MDITSSPRDKGVHVIRTVGMQGWAEDHGDAKAHGVRLELMDSRNLLAVCKLEVPGTLGAEQRGAEEAERIEPWVRTLRYLATVQGLRAELRHVETLLAQAEIDEQSHLPMLDHLRDELRAFADTVEVTAAEATDHFDPLGAPLARIVAARLRGQVSSGLQAALAFAPDVNRVPIHPAWERPTVSGMPGTNLAQEVARDLLAGWAAARDRRDPLVTWAVREAGLTRSEVQGVTSISRSTINRLLPD